MRTRSAGRTRGHGALGATFCSGESPAVAAGAANTGSERLSAAVAQGRRRRFPVRLSQSVLQHWRWFKCGSGDGGGASVLPCLQPPSESATEEGGAAVDLISLGLRGLRSSGVGGWQVQPELWILLPCDSPGNGWENSKWVLAMV